MKTAKQEALDLLSRLPDDVSTETIIGELLFVLKVNQGLAQLERGEVVSHEDVKKQFLNWQKSSGP